MIGFSSNSVSLPSSPILTTPKRLTSTSARISLHTTVMSAFFSIWNSRTLLKSSLYTQSPLLMITYGSCLRFKNSIFWYIASAVPLYQSLFSAVMVGVNKYNPPCFLPKFHHLDELRCSLSERALYCVSTATV